MTWCRIGREILLVVNIPDYYAIPVREGVPETTVDAGSRLADRLLCCITSAYILAHQLTV